MSRKFIQKMFPEGTLNGRGGTEVNGLPSGSAPQNVSIIRSWDGNNLSVRPREELRDRRDFYHVTDGEHCALLRVCTAMEGSGYDEFAVIHIVAEHDTPEADALNDTAYCWFAAADNNRIKRS